MREGEGSLKTKNSTELFGEKQEQKGQAEKESRRQKDTGRRKYGKEIRMEKKMWKRNWKQIKSREKRTGRSRSRDDNRKKSVKKQTIVERKEKERT